MSHNPNFGPLMEHKKENRATGLRNTICDQRQLFRKIAYRDLRQYCWPRPQWLDLLYLSGIGASLSKTTLVAYSHAFRLGSHPCSSRICTHTMSSYLLSAVSVILLFKSPSHSLNPSSTLVRPISPTILTQIFFGLSRNDSLGNLHLQGSLDCGS